MGSVSLKLADAKGGGAALRLRRAVVSSSSLNLLMLASLLATNLFTLLSFSSSPTGGTGSRDVVVAADINVSAHLELLLRDLVAGGSSSSSSSLSDPSTGAGGFRLAGDLVTGDLPAELRLFLTPHLLPLGRDARSGLTHMTSSVSHHCLARRSATLAAYMTYSPHAACPAAAAADPHKLISIACEPLPRRRCLTRPPPTPLFVGVGNSSRWVKPRSKHEFLIDDVLALSERGGRVKIGFDIAGGHADFAARMAERGVTIFTSVLNSGGRPVNELVASRGLFPLLLSPAHRFPFHDGVFDLVHVGAALDEGAAPAMARSAGQQEAMEFLLFDVDRVVRTGGLVWIDSYLCADGERRRALARLIDKFGYKKLKWVVAEKADGNGERRQQPVYLSAVLQKPPLAARRRTV